MGWVRSKHLKNSVLCAAFAVACGAVQAAGEYGIHCAELFALGADRTAACGEGLRLHTGIRSEDPLEVLRVGYEDKEKALHVTIEAEIQRVSFASEAEGTLQISGMLISQRSTTGEDRAGFVQGPAKGSCVMSGLNAATPTFRCAIRGVDARLGEVRLAFNVLRTTLGNDLIKELREARFALASAEQAGRFKPMQAASQPFQPIAQLVEAMGAAPAQSATPTAGNHDPDQFMKCASFFFKDDKKAASCLQKMTEGGDARAPDALAILYHEGRGVPRSPATARRLFMLAAERGNVGTLMDLGRFHENGASDSPIGPVKRDIAKAIEYFKRAGATDHAAKLQAAQAQVGKGVDPTVYGIGVGFRFPSMSGCEFAENMAKLRPRERAANWCLDGTSTMFSRFFDAIGAENHAFAQSGLRLRAVQVNDETMDTGILFNPLGISSATLLVAVDRDDTVHFISAATRITATDQVLKMLTSKYGQPSGSAEDEWVDTRTGDIVRRTPVYFWMRQGLQVEFHAQDSWNLNNAQAPKGRIDVRTPAFTEVLQRFAAEAQQAQPPRGRF